jgi:N5-(cytidine 5'-diphosphoramidyl)-L-glutamine hydrolase
MKQKKRNQKTSIIIGITQRVDYVSGRDELRDALDQRLVDWVRQAGLIPVAVPNTLLGDDCSSGVVLEDWLRAVKPNALFLSGGNDIGDFPSRDATESCLLSWAETNRVPVLGICRGMQMMAVWAGDCLKVVEGHVCTRHVIQGGVTGEVNSYHNFSLARCPKGFEILARSDDGEIEAIRHTILPWEGWMWHPEREANFSSHDTDRLKELFT